jgi:hypothetical protein
MGKNNTISGKTSKTKITGISLPEQIVKIIDYERGDVSRSKFILRILEKILPSENSGHQKVAEGEN